MSAELANQEPQRVSTSSLHTARSSPRDPRVPRLHGVLPRVDKIRDFGMTRQVEPSRPWDFCFLTPIPPPFSHYPMPSMNAIVIALEHGTVPSLRELDRLKIELEQFPVSSPNQALPPVIPVALPLPCLAFSPPTVQQGPILRQCSCHTKAELPDSTHHDTHDDSTQSRRNVSRLCQPTPSTPQHR